MAERPNALALKASVPNTDRGFKSLYLRSNPQWGPNVSPHWGVLC